LISLSIDVDDLILLLPLDSNNFPIFDVANKTVKLQNPNNNNNNNDNNNNNNNGF